MRDLAGSCNFKKNQKNMKIDPKITIFHIISYSDFFEFFLNF